MKAFTLFTCLMLALPAKAELVTYNFTGTVSYITEQAGSDTAVVKMSNLAGKPISLEHTFRGSFSYDTEAKPLNQPDPDDYFDRASYSPVGKITFLFEQSGIRFDSANSMPYLLISDGRDKSQFDALSYSAVEEKGVAAARAQFFFTGNKDALSSNAIPATLPLSKLYGSFSYTYAYGMAEEYRMLNIMGDFNSIELASISPVPEPGSYATLCIGLAGIFFIRKRRQANAM